MSKRRVLILAVVLLAMMNIVFIVFHFLRPKHPMMGDMNKMEMLSKELDFDKSQRKSYKKLVISHQGQVKKLRKKQVAIKNALYKTIGEEGQESNRAERMERLSVINDEIEFMNLEHFDDIRKLCSEDQIPKFKKFRSKLETFFSPPKPPMKK